MTFRHPDGDTHEFVVCADCAQQLTPVRATIDLTALEQKRDDYPLDPVVSLVEYVLQRRSPPPTDRLPLRAADLHVLATTYETTPRAFALALQASGVAADVQL
ncbi:MAG: hypothetical protein R3320_04545 [Nitriliruptorales bacterium]|nr:hypothetical protein [Nitriliruptorales bacterium]